MGWGGAIKLNKRGYALICLVVIIFFYFHFQYKSQRDGPSEISLSRLLQASVDAAVAGGKLVVSTRENLKIESKGKTKEGMDDSVTTADFLSHCAMKGIITRAFPNVRFISEENDIPCKEGKALELSTETLFEVPKDVLVRASDVTVWIDPLDATHEYTEKLYQYVTTMVCVAVKGEPIIGVIHSPFNGSTYWAISGYAHSNNLKRVKNKEDAQKTKVIISRSHSGSIEEVLKKNFKNVETIVAAGAGYKVIKVAEGVVDAYLHITAIKKWDICAGNAILNALGGRMTTKHGKYLTYYNETDVVNKEGLIATLANHELFVGKLNNLN